jgi:glycosyltransferase involved in cell wall biosynthesis
MKFSVLLPTHNRLEFLKYAIASVVRQKYDEWEIIVSDNYSEQDVAGYVKSLNNPKIKYFRTGSFVSVTENWNNAIDQSTGDYVIMLGDDDCLMQGYFENILKIVADFDCPELIYSNAFLYAYPGVLPDFPNGCFRTMGNCNLWEHKKPFELSDGKRSELLKQTYHFRVAFGYNMQFATMHRNLIERIRYQGKFFHSPYPDYYAMTLMMEKAEKVVCCPYPIVTVGITPKSFGFFYYNQKEEDGMRFLNTSSELKDHPELASVILPGSHMNTCWLCSLNCVQRALSKKIPLNYKRYRNLQVIEFFQAISPKPERAKNIALFLQRLKGSDRLTYGAYLWSMLALRSAFGVKITTLGYKVLKKLLNSHPAYPFQKWENTHQNILEVFERIDPLKL